MIFSFIFGISQFIHIWKYQALVSRPVSAPVEVLGVASTSIPIKIQLEKDIALTFDDGPYGTTTAQILDILEKENVPATFFLIGKNVLLHPDQVRREVADGDVIGNHSFSHATNLAIISSSSLRADISRAQTIITQTSSRIPHLFRPPYSRTSSGMIKEVTSEGYIMSGWNIDPRDWDNSNSSSTVIFNVLNYIKPNGVIIFHDGHEKGTNYSRENTIEALPFIIDTLKKDGYTFVTMDRMLGVNPYR